jgi:hypothetical protein
MPEKQQSPQFYSRLCDEWTNYPRRLMRQLADWIEDTPDHRGDRPLATPELLPSAYVYFGQWITHDLSHDGTRLSEAGELAPNATINARTARLDLETLYGKTRETTGPLYDVNHPRGDGYLALGHTAGTASVLSSDNDLLRDNFGIAEIYDDRNDSTLLLAQLQVLLIKFHNRLLDDVRDGNVAAVPGGGDPFEQTRRLARWHYQWIVRNDFLPKVVMSDVLDDIIMHWPRLYRPKTGQASIPVEFTLAAFQYGHSAVQFIYNIGDSGGLCSQEETMYLTGLGQFVRPGSNDKPSNRLPEIFVVDPDRMFGFAPPARSNFAANLGTLITGGLYKVPGELSKILNNEPLRETGLIPRHSNIPTFKLPEATLRRGAAVGLPSGQQACECAGVRCLSPDQLAYDSRLEDFLKANGLLHRTPLFYYLLREAEVSGRTTPAGFPGKRLGPLGSRIVAEVILGVLNADPESYVNAYWEPPVISGDFPENDFRIDTLPKLALYAKGYTGYLE